MDTKTALLTTFATLNEEQQKDLESEAWEDFLDMLRNAIKNGLVITRLDNVSLNQQIHAQFYRFLPGAGLCL